MDFRWSSEQEELFAQTQAFAADALGKQAEASRELWLRCKEYGLTALCLPEQYGGLELGALMTARLLEAAGQATHGTGFLFSIGAHLLAFAKPVFKHGKASCVAKVGTAIAGGAIGAVAITEGESGSDAFALETAVEKKDGQYILNGTKSYVTSGSVADYFLVYAQHHPGSGAPGISAFVVPRDTPGVSVGTPYEQLGPGGFPPTALYLQDCAVPEENLVGRECRGALLFYESMMWERSCMFAIYLGMMQDQLERAIRHARDRKQFGVPIASKQAVSHKIVDMKMRLESARYLVYRACCLLDEGSRRADEASAIAKVAVTEAAVQCSLDVIQIFGASGLSNETGLPQQLLAAIPSTISTGTTEVTKNIIAKHLGLGAL